MATQEANANEQPEGTVSIRVGRKGHSERAKETIRRAKEAANQPAIARELGNDPTPEPAIR
jgi:hypothetical protein